MQEWEKTRQTLLGRIQNQSDETSWNDFIAIYQKFIYAIIRQMNIRPDDAEDITQTVLLVLWNKLPEMEVKEIRHFRNWVASISRNCVIDYIRKQQRQAERLQEAIQDENHAYLKRISLPKIDLIIEKRWKIHITNLALENIKHQVSKRSLEVFELSMKGVSIGEIAEQLNIKTRSASRMKTLVKSKIIAEIKRLRTELG